MESNDILERLLDKQEQMANDIGEIKVILGKQEQSLSFHILRTNQNEEKIELLQSLLQNSIDKLEQDIEPVKKHVYLIDAGAKIIGGISVGISIVLGLLKIFGISL